MIKIRLKRYGRKKLPTYRLVVMDQKTKRDGKDIEELGFYNPRTKETKLNIQKIIKRLEQGAQPTDTVKNLFIKAKII